MFKTNDYVVYPGHGVGRVTALETKEILGRKTKFYSVSILDSGMKIMVPVNHATTVGLRAIATQAVAKKALAYLKSPQSVSPSGSWSMRYREYMESIKSGDLMEVAQVFGALKQLNADKQLSFGERKMLDVARTLMFTEIGLALGLGDSDMTGLMELA